MKRVFQPGIALVLMVASTMNVMADDIDKQLNVLRNVGPGGKGSREARSARDILGRQGPDILPRLLVAMDTPNIVAANWYRTVYEQILRRELAKKEPRLPLQFMKRYLRDQKRQGRVRRLVFDQLNQLDPEYGRKLLPTLLDDPEFREQAVDLALKRGDAAKKRDELELAKQEYRKAFRHARDSRQVTQSADRLKAVGVAVSIIEHMGFVTDWYLLGPFDAPGMSGFETVFPPEKKTDLNARYTGKTGAEIRWKRFQTTDRLAQINLIQAVAAVKEAVGFAYTELISPRDQVVQLRCGADDNLSVWLNGKQIFSRLQWLNGTRLDRFTATAELKAGTNRLLVKICQGPQHKNPAVPNNWSMQLRFCDAQGTGVGLKSVLPLQRETNKRKQPVE